MKKITLLITSIIMLFTLTGCTKVSQTPDQVTQILTGLEYKVTDISDKYQEYNNIYQVLKIEGNEDVWKIEFYTMKDISSAKKMYEEEKNILLLFEPQAIAYSEVNSGNYNTYKVITNGSYMYISRVDNTILTIDVSAVQRDNMDILIETLGY